MGTSYSVVVTDADRLSTDSRRALAWQIEQALVDLNAVFSTWQQDAEISRFNRSRSTQPQAASPELLEVIDAAMEIGDVSQGRFDITLGPLIDAWGFGAPGMENEPPDDHIVQQALTRTGQDRLLDVDRAAGTLRKRRPDTEINLSAIAKGYAVDRLAALVAASGSKSFMVEIGGDLRAQGVNAQGQHWQIGVERPEPGGRSVQTIVALRNQAMATSGDYRNYFERNGVRYSHIIDPVDGYPVRHRSTSVSVIADTAMAADAWATALLVLGSERGLVVAEAQQIAALFIDHTTASQAGAAEFTTLSSSAFEALALDEKL